LCLNLATVWREGSIGVKEKLQKLLFPEGLAYDRQIGAFRTDKINSIIAVIARLSGDSAIIEKGLTLFLSDKSLSAEK
jgi:site-specific DNA recombinase